MNTVSLSQSTDECKLCVFCVWQWKNVHPVLNWVTVQLKQLERETGSETAEKREDSWWQRDGVRLERRIDKCVRSSWRRKEREMGDMVTERWKWERSAESGCLGRSRWKCLSGDMCISISSVGEGHDIEWRWHSEVCSSQVNHYQFVSSLTPSSISLI